MTETTALFADGRLAGTLLRPTVARGDVALLLLNAGILPRQGPHRFNVKLARAVAALGIPSLRFDLSGLGDSEPAREARSWREQAAADIVTAVDFALHTLDCRRVALVGICSGADNGLAAALLEPRVRGLFMLDGYAYPTPKTRWLRWLKRLRPARLWQRGPPWLRERWRALRGQAGAPVASGFVRGEPSRAEYATRLQKLAERGVRLQLMFSGSLHDQYNYAGQFVDAFKASAFIADVRCEFAPDVDHTLTSLHAQQRVLTAACVWLTKMALAVETAGESAAHAAASPASSRADEGDERPNVQSAL